MKASKRLLLLIVFSLIFIQGYTQIEDEQRKGQFNLTYKFNFTDDSYTKEHVPNGHSILINRKFTLDRLLSLAPVIDYTYLKAYERQHQFSLGAQAYFYPLHFISILKEEGYESSKDNYFMSWGLYKTISKGDISSIFDLNFYIYTLSIGRHLKVTPTIGASFYRPKEQSKEDLNYYNIGLNFGF